MGLLAEVAIPVDYYAGALAMFAIVLFAKFATHRHHSERNRRGQNTMGSSRSDERPPRNWFRRLHVICVLFAWLGALSCLAVLGWGEPVFREQWYRHAVAVFAGIAVSILAFDVFRDSE